MLCGERQMPSAILAACAQLHHLEMLTIDQMVQNKKTSFRLCNFKCTDVFLQNEPFYLIS